MCLTTIQIYSTHVSGQRWKFGADLSRLSEFCTQTRSNKIWLSLSFCFTSPLSLQNFVWILYKGFVINNTLIPNKFPCCWFTFYDHKFKYRIQCEDQRTHHAYLTNEKIDREKQCSWNGSQPTSKISVLDCDLKLPPEPAQRMRASKQPKLSQDTNQIRSANQPQYLFRKYLASLLKLSTAPEERSEISQWKNAR